MAPNVSGHRIIVAGGSIGLIGTDAVEAFDGQAWTRIEPLPTPVVSAAVVVYQSQMMIMGGVTHLSWLNTVFVLGENSANWTQGVPLPANRSSGGAAVVDNKVYVVAGTDGSAAGDPPNVLEFNGTSWITISVAPDDARSSILLV